MFPVHLTLLSCPLVSLVFVFFGPFSSVPASRPNFMSPELRPSPGLPLGFISVPPPSASLYKCFFFFKPLRTVSLRPAHRCRDVMAPPWREEITDLLNRLLCLPHPLLHNAPSFFYSPWRCTVTALWWSRWPPESLKRRWHPNLRQRSKRPAICLRPIYWPELSRDAGSQKLEAGFVLE